MRAIVVYESMFGNTHRVADAIGQGLTESGEFEHVFVVPVDDADDELVRGTDLLVIGGPTHVRGLSRRRSREQAVTMATKPATGVTLDINAPGTGLREWLDLLRVQAAMGAAFDTRLPFPLAGRASRKIERKLIERGYSLAVRSESFLVDNHNVLHPGEIERASAWGRHLAAAVATHRVAA